MGLRKVTMKYLVLVVVVLAAFVSSGRAEDDDAARLEKRNLFARNCKDGKKIGSCTNRGGWQDQLGYTCTDYQRRGWCIDNGEEHLEGLYDRTGPAWNIGWGCLTCLGSLWKSECRETAEVCEECGCTGSGTDTIFNPWDKKN